MAMKMLAACVVPVAAALLCGCASARFPDSGEIRLEGDYAGHLQDVWFDGAGRLYWAHTHEILMTDLTGRILKRRSVEGHHAGIEVRNGRIYVAVCPMQKTTGGKTTPECRVTVGEYDAETLDLIAMHVTDINDRSGSLAILDDGTFLVGCLRPQDIRPDQVRFHHLDRNFRLIRSYVLDNVPIKLGIEVIRRQGDGYLLCLYGVDRNDRKLDFNCIRLDGDFKETWRGRLDGAWGLVSDGKTFWTGKTEQDKATNRYTSKLIAFGAKRGF